jgi:methylenetetrahydrofolate reductase (NADPH)
VIDRSHLAAILRRLADLEMREIFVIGGDARQPAGSFPSALDLLQAMAGLKHAVEQIGIAGYPENHPLVDRRILQQALLEKQPFATYIVTQICFNPKVITAWLAGMRQSGITLPVYIGLPGAVDLKRLLRISMKIGVGDSTRFLAKNTGLAARLFKPVGYEPTDLVEALAPSLSSPELDIQGFHLNTFNQVDGTERWRQRMLKTHAVQRAV